MIEYASTHRKVIACIHENWKNGDPFAIHQIVRASGVSNSSVKRTLGYLVYIRHVSKTKKAFAGKFYRVSKTWPRTVTEAISNYETAKMVGI